MATQTTFPYSGAIDADGHILEPPDIWEKYIDPQYRTGPSACVLMRRAWNTWKSMASPLSICPQVPWLPLEPWARNRPTEPSPTQV